MNQDIVYLTFPTSKDTAKVLTELAHAEGKNQPELLDKICRDYIEKTLAEVLFKIDQSGVNLEDLAKRLEDRANQEG